MTEFDLKLVQMESPGLSFRSWRALKVIYT